MAADKPAKAPPLYEGAWNKSTDSRASLAGRHPHAKVHAMKRVLPILMLAACSQQPAPLPANATEAAPTPNAAMPAAKPFEYNEDSDLIEFHYSWSTEMAAVPQLVARFQAELEKEKADLTKLAAADANHPYAISKDISTKGQSPWLLSLFVEFYEFTGGAHGNHGAVGLLWDRQVVKEIEVADLFVDPRNMDRLLTQRWCDELNKAREEKRGEPVGGEGMFDECPKLGEIAIIPTDKDKNARFERLLLVASPYVAGPYVEGSYEIELPVTPDLIAALKADYRESFEAAQTQ